MDLSKGIFLYFAEKVNEYLDFVIAWSFEHSVYVFDIFKYIVAIGVVVKIFKNFIESPTNWFGYFSYVPLVVFFFNYQLVIALFWDSIQYFDQLTSLTQQEDLIKIFFTPNIKFELEEIRNINLFNISFYVLCIVGMRVMDIVFGSMLLEGVSVVSLLMYMYHKIRIVAELVLLTFFGPFNISSAFLPGFEGADVEWFLKLCKTCAKLVVLFLIDFIGVAVLDFAFKDLVITDVGDAIDGRVFVWMGIFFFAGIGFLYYKIDKLTDIAVSKATSGAGGIGKYALAAYYVSRKLLVKV